MNALFTFVLIACAASAAQAIFSTGTCYNVPAIPNFKVTRVIKKIV